MMGLLAESVRFDALRYLRSPALIYVALATPIAAYYMVPDESASYAVLSVNGFSPEMTASVLGLELGVVAALLLTPLAYIFLKAGPTRNRPWQISDVAPHSRMVWALGRWVADTFMLWVLLAFLTAAGLILGAFKIGAQSNVLHTVVALWAPAAPSMALVAGLRLVLDARNLTRNWLGDVLFVIVWLAMVIIGTLGADQPETEGLSSNPLADAFGFTSPIIGSVDTPVTAVAIIGSTAGQSIPVDAWAGVTDPDYMIARAVWLGVAALLALLAGLMWGPRKAKANRPAPGAGQRSHASVLDTPFKAPARSGPASPNPVSIVLAEMDQVFKSRIWIGVLLAAAILGAVVEFRTLGGPAMVLALIFPLTEASARWQGQATQPWLNTLGPGPLERLLARWAAHIGVACLVLAPAFTLSVIEGEVGWVPHMLVIASVLPAVIVGTGAVTRSPVTGRLLLLIAWYAYLSSA
jgi:hypothetical protein